MGESELETWLALPHASFDVVIMNPPFTRATGHEGKKIGVPNPMFAAFSSSAEEQKLMGKATKRLTEGTSAHGNAGEASIFLVLADRKLKRGGVLALVMPLSLMSGEAWDDSRALLAKDYTDLILVSIAGTDGADLSFSADTDMGECLLVGRKDPPEVGPDSPPIQDNGSKRATFIILNERPAFPMLGASAAKQIHELMAGGNIRGLEDGPSGGTPLHFGADLIGQAIEAPLPKSGAWNLSRIADLSLAQTAYQIEKEKRIWLPTMNKSEAVHLPIATVSAIGKIGPYHADINGVTSTGGLRGPFIIEELKTTKTAPTYPVIWSHDAKLQRSISFDGESQGLPRKAVIRHKPKLPGETKEQEKERLKHEEEEQVRQQALIDEKVASIWKTASHCHFNRDFRFNSQSTSMQFTPRRTIGGRAWISVRLSSVAQEKALVLWANTSLGLLLHWYNANKQQSGRGSVGVLALQDFPVLDVTALTPQQLAAAVQLFDAMADLDLLPFHEIDKDPVRRDLDSNFARDVLGLAGPIIAPGGPLELLRMKLAREPSIRGHKA
jgi:hypothetical protein